MFCFLVAVLPLLRTPSDRVAHHFSPVLPTCCHGYHHHHHRTPGLSLLFVGSDGSPVDAFGLYGIVTLVCLCLDCIMNALGLVSMRLCAGLMGRRSAVHLPSLRCFSGMTLSQVPFYFSHT